MSTQLDSGEGLHARRDAHPLQLFYDRHAVRAYASTVVDQRSIRALLDVAVHAPTAVDEEPWRFLIIQDREVLRELSDRAKADAIANAAEQGNILKPPGAAGDGMRSMLANPDFNVFYDAGTLIVICANISTPFVVADCWLAAENLMLAATALGLGTCVIGFAADALNAPDVKRRLNIPRDVVVVAPIIVGHPRGETPPVVRRAPVILEWVRESD